MSKPNFFASNIYSVPQESVINGEKNRVHGTGLGRILDKFHKINFVYTTSLSHSE